MLLSNRLFMQCIYQLPKTAVQIRLPQTMQLTTEIHSLIVLEAGSPKSRYLSGGPCSLRRVYGRIISCLFQLLKALGISCGHITLICLHIHMAFTLFLCLLLCLLLTHLSLDLRPTLMVQDNFILKSLITATKTLFHNRVHSQVLGFRIQTCLFQPTIANMAN